MKKIARVAGAGVLAAALLAGGASVAFADDTPKVTWDQLVANCPDLADSPKAAEMQAELEYFNMDVLPELPADLAKCVAAAPEAPEGDAYVGAKEENAYLDAAEAEYNRLTKKPELPYGDAYVGAEEENAYLDAAEAEYNRLLNESTSDAETTPADEVAVVDTPAKDVKAEAKPAAQGRQLAHTGGPLAALLAIAGVTGATGLGGVLLRRRG